MAIAKPTALFLHLLFLVTTITYSVSRHRILWVNCVMALTNCLSYNSLCRKEGVSMEDEILTSEYLRE